MPGSTGRGSSPSPPTSRRSATSTRCGSGPPGSGSGGPARSTTGRSGRSPGVYGRCFAGIAALAQLDLAAAEEHLNGAVALARESAGRRSHAAQLAGALLGELHYERGELEEAERLLEESRELGAESGVVDFMVASYAVLARIKAHRGAEAEAAELLAEGAKVAERLGLTRLSAAVVAERIRQLLAARRVREARWAAQDLPDGGGCHGGIGVAIDQIRTGSLAAVLSAEGDHDGAAALLEELIGDLDRRGQVRAAVDGDGRARRRRRNARRAGSPRSARSPAALALVRARGAAADRRRRRPRGRDGAGLAARAPGGAVARQRRRPCRGRPRRAARPPRRRSGEGHVPASTAASWPSCGCWTPGAATRRSRASSTVTVNTVKWYLKNIYAKLGATSRAEAVSTARRGGLLS